MKAFSSEHKQFAGTGKLSEYFSASRQTFTNHSKTLHLSEPEILNKLVVLFKPNSSAVIFNHKHEISVAKNLEHAFSMVYRRFEFAERRDRLLDMLNNLNFLKYLSKSASTKHSALRQLCGTEEVRALENPCANLKVPLPSNNRECLQIITSASHRFKFCTRFTVLNQGRSLYVEK